MALTKEELQKVRRLDIAIIVPTLFFASTKVESKGLAIALFSIALGTLLFNAGNAIIEARNTR